MNRRRIYPTLEHWRRAQGWSQREAAQYLRVSQPTYSRIVRKLQVPRPKTAEAWSAETGVPLEAILGLAS